MAGSGWKLQVTPETKFHNGEKSMSIHDFHPGDTVAGILKKMPQRQWPLLELEPTVEANK